MRFTDCGWCDIRWKVLWQHLSIGGVANFFGYLFGGYGSLATAATSQSKFYGDKKKKKRDNVFIALCLVWNRLYKVFSSVYSVHGTGLEHLGTVSVPYFFGHLPANITPMEQVEQAQPTSMKIYNIFMTVLCFKNVLQKVLC